MTARRAFLAVLFVAAYALLDRVSFIHSFNALNITPWNPPPGLGLAVLLLGGARLAPLVFAGALAADFWVRGLPPPWWGAVGADAAMALVYAVAAHVARHRLRLDLDLAGLRDVLLLLALSTVAAGLAAFSYVGCHFLAGGLPRELLAGALARYWIGDMIGLAVFTPLLLLFRRPSMPPLRVMAEAAAQALALAGALWLVFGLGASANFQFFYLLFPPLIWAATRFGLHGAAAANLGAQLGLIAVFRAVDAAIVTTFQFLMLALAMVTLVLGAAISERRRVQAVLHARQDEMAQIGRLSTAGEMAAALAHELNQPLLAAIAFTRGAQRLLAGDPVEPDMEKVRGALDRAVAESQRAGDIVRSLREFIGTGRRSRSAESLVALVADSLAVVRPDCARLGIRLTASVDKSLPAIHVDKVQMAQVILNLVRNAMDALPGGGEIAVSAEAAADEVVVQVADTGHGLAEDVAEQLFKPFNTSKATGMGLGLTICRSLVEAHGGRLWLDRTGSDGTVFRFTLPTAIQNEENR